MQTITHPVSGTAINGFRLAPGAMIQEGDLYDSTDGKWRPAGCSHAGGKVPKGEHVIWVRVGELSSDAQELLSYLMSQPHGPQTCAAEHNGEWYVVSDPAFNWDARIDYQAGRVRHPECLQELAEFGHLVLGEQKVRNWESDHSPVPTDGINRVYALTHEV